MIEKRKEKKIYKYINFIGVFAIVFSLIAISTSGITLGTDSGIWQLITGNTVTLIPDKGIFPNVQIGENISTLERFRVTGNSEFNGSVNIVNPFNFLSNGYTYLNGLESYFRNTIIFEDNGLLLSQGNVDFDNDVNSQRFKVDFENTYFNDNVVFNDTVTFNGNVDFKGEITYNGYDVSLLPEYSIQMYGGRSTDFNSYGYLLNDTHWHLCNGKNGTVNLTDRFVVGAGNTYAQNSSGGSNTFTIAAQNLPTYVYSITQTKTSYTLVTGLVPVVTNVVANTGGSASPAAISNIPVYRGLYYIEFMGYD